jgi:hypothetical protein
MSWGDGDFTLLALRERQNAMIIQTICDMLTSEDKNVRTLMDYFEVEEAQIWGIGISERENNDDIKVFLRWAGENTDMSEVDVGKMHSIFPGAFMAVQESDISVFIRNGKAQLHDDTVVEPFSISKFSRPAMWITQSVMRKNHWDSFANKVMASHGWRELHDNPASNHFLKWEISHYDDQVLQFVVEIRLNALKAPATMK